MSLPRVLWLEDGEMRMDVPEEIELLRYRPELQQNIEIQSDAEVTMERIRGKSIEIQWSLWSPQQRSLASKLLFPLMGKSKR